MPHRDGHSLWEIVSGGLAHSAPALWGLDGQVALRDLATSSCLDTDIEALRGRSVVIKTAEQLFAAIALIELDGIAKRLVLCPPDVAAEHLPDLIRTAEGEIVLTDNPTQVAGLAACARRVSCGIPKASVQAARRHADRQTEWVLLTSGTTGAPKLVSHSLASLTGAIEPETARPEADPDQTTIWSTFYDIRRYGGLQILLRALLGGASMVLSNARETTGAFLVRAGRRRVTHISGTPTHWRRALMTLSANRIAPRYVRLSGEIADQAILDQLQAAYPTAKVAHAFAATEAGVGFSVEDGLAGFPARLLDEGCGDVEFKIRDESLWIRSPLTASHYLGDTHKLSTDPDGFVDTGDVIERRADRYYFVGRKGGIINVGGLKVHPEEVEAVINRHDRVRLSLVHARKNPFTGAIVVADVVLKIESEEDTWPTARNTVKEEILKVCRGALAAHKVPAIIRFVPQLVVGASGKLVRRHG